MTESQNGVVYAVTTDGERSTGWMTTGGNGEFRRERNHPRRRRRQLVAVTRATEETGRLLRVPVESDGAAGEPSMFFEGGAIFGADGITAVTATSTTRPRLAPRRQSHSDGTSDVVATADNALEFPSDVLCQTGDRRSRCHPKLANRHPKTAQFSGPASLADRPFMKSFSDGNFLSGPTRAERMADET